MLLTQMPSAGFSIDAWCVLPLPVSTVQYFGVSSRLRDFAPDDWLNFYDLRRESMWLADA